LKYPVDLQLDTNGPYLVMFPDIPEAATSADTKEEALVMAVAAKAMLLTPFLFNNSYLFLGKRYTDQRSAKYSFWKLCS